MRRILLFLTCIMLTSTLAYGQAYTFTFTQDGGNPGGINTQTSDADQSGWIDLLTNTQVQANNQWSAPITIPFNFSYFGNPVTQFKASANGLVTFDIAATALPSANAALPSTALPDSTIAAFWDDYPASITSPNDEVQYQVFGTPGSRQLWIRWFSMTVGNPPSGWFYFNVVLEEGTNRIYIVDTYTSSVSSQATVGLQLDQTTAVSAGSNLVGASNGVGDADNDYYTFTPVITGVDMIASGVLFSDLANAGCGTANETVSIVVQNFGTATVTNPTVSYSVNGGAPVTETFTGTFNTGDIDTFTFATPANFAAVGTYTVDATVSAPGDVNPGNNTLTSGISTIAPQTLPLQPVDFDGFTGANLPTITSNLWYEAEGIGIPDSGASSWFDDDFGNNTASPNGTAARINYFFTGDDEWIVSPKVDCQSNSAVSYDLALTTGGGTAATNLGSDDVFQLLVSTDCGSSWTPLQTFDANSVISPTGQTETLSLGAFAGQEIILAFYASEGTVADGSSLDLFLDNILVYNAPDYDLGVSDLLLPTGSVCASPQGAAVVEVTNFGAATIDPNVDPFDVTLTVNGNTYTNAYSGQPLPPGGTAQVLVSAVVDLSQPGLTSVEAYTTLLGANPDGLNFNDTLVSPINILPIETVPYTQDFETGFSPSTTFADGWTSSTSSDPQWEVEDGPTGSSNTGPDGDHTTGSGQYVYLETSGGTSGDQSVFRSPCLDLTSADPNLRLEYWYHMFGATIGRLDVQVWTDTDTFTIDSIIGPQQSADTDPWKSRTIDLSPFANTTVKLAFIGTRGASFTGDIAIDDVSIYVAPATDLAVSNILLPEAEFCAIPQDVAVVEVINFGSGVIDPAVDPFEVSMEVNGTLYTGNYTGGPLAPSATGQVLVSPSVDYSTPGFTQVKAWTTLLGPNPDAITANDTALKNIEIIPIQGLPYVVDFEEPDWNNTTTYASGWTVSSNATYTWEVEDGAVFPTSTGPEVDHTLGTGTGQYLYTDTGSGSGDSTVLRSPCLELIPQDPNNNVALEFWYHFFGADIGTLKISVQDNAGNTIPVFTLSGEQQTAATDSWQKATVDLTAFKGQTVKLLFTGLEGGPGSDQDLAIDDFFIYEVQPFDVSAVSLDLPPDNGCLTNAESVTATVTHSGITPIDLNVNPLVLNLDVAGFPLQTVNITTAPGGGSTLNPGDTLDYTFTADYSQGGFIPTTFYLEMAPDLLLVNDTISDVVASGSFAAPYFENFETFEAQAAGNPLGPGWVSANPDYAWEVEDGPTGSTNTGPGVDNTTGQLGGKYLYAESSFPAAAGDTALLTSPCIDLGTLTNPRLEFFYHMYGAEIGELRVMVEDGAGNLDTVLVAIGQQDTDEAPDDPWNKVTYDLTAFAGQTINVLFEAVYGTGFEGDIAIDDVLIYEPTGIDVGVVSIDGPAPASLFTPQTIDVSVVNFEQITLDLAVNPVTVTLESTPTITGAPFTATVPGDSIQSGDTITFTITTAADFSAGGVFDLEAFTTVTGDAIPFNDGAEFQVVSLPLFTPPYNEDFENFTPDGNFSGNGTGTTFSWINDPAGPTTQYNWSFAAGPIGTTLSGPNADHTLGTPAGIYAYTEGSFGAVGDTTQLLSSSFDLSTATEAALEFYYHMYGSNMGTMMANVVESDGTRTTVWTFSGQLQTDDLDPWAFAFANLGPWLGDTIQVEFLGVRGGFNSDMALDDVYVGPPTQTDVAALQVVSPASPGCLDSTMAVQVQVVSQGAAIDFATTSLTVSAELTGVTGPALFDTTLTSGILGVGDTLDLALSGLANLGAPGTYQIELSALLAGGDSLPGNDSIIVNYTKVDTQAIPIGPVTFDGYTGSNLATAFPGWDEGDGPGIPEIGATSSWFRDDFGNDAANPNGDAARINLGSLTLDEWIVSPPFIPGALDVLSFDLAVTDELSSPAAKVIPPDSRVLVMITTDCGASWTSLKEYNSSSNISNTGQKDFVQIDQFAGQEIRIAFYAQGVSSGVTTDDVDFFVDNILIEPGNQFDAALLGRLSPLGGECGDSTMTGEVEIANFGVDTLSNLPLQITVTEIGGGSVVFNDTFPGPLALGETGIHTFGPFDTYSGGTFEIEAIANLAGDQETANDTLADTLSFGNSAPPVVAAIPEFCPGDSLTLVATDSLGIGVQHAWAETLNGPVIALGDTFQTPPITAATSYFVRRVAASQSVGPVDTLVSPEGGFRTFEAGQVFDVLQPLELASVRTFPESAGDIIIELRDNAGAVIEDTTIQFGGTVGDTVVGLGWTIPVGTDYLLVSPTGGTGLFRNDGAATTIPYPYEIPGVISITGTGGSGAGANFYYYFYDWSIKATSCPHADQEVSLVPSVAEAGFAVDSLGDLYLALSDTSSNADSVRYFFGDGNSSNDPNPVYNYADTGTYVVQQVAYSFCGTDTFETELTIECTEATADFNIEIVPDSNGVTVRFISQAQNADSILFDFGTGVTTSSPDTTIDFEFTGTYTFCMTAYNLCGEVQSCQEVSLQNTGLNLIDGTSISLYPNPTEGAFELAMDILKAGALDIEVVDMRGRSIHQESFQTGAGLFKHRFDLEGRLSEGVYLIKIMADDQMIMRKLQVE